MEGTKSTLSQFFFEHRWPNQLQNLFLEVQVEEKLCRREMLRVVRTHCLDVASLQPLPCVATSVHGYVLCSQKAKWSLSIYHSSFAYLNSFSSWHITDPSSFPRDNTFPQSERKHRGRESLKWTSLNQSAADFLKSKFLQVKGNQSGWKQPNWYIYQARRTFCLNRFFFS